MNLSFEEFGKGKPFVLLHAFPLSRSMWKPNIEALTKENYRVVTPDLRGFGETNLKNEISPIEDMAKDVAELLDKLNIEKAIIGGLSMGGYVTFNFYRLFPEKCSALVFCDTNCEADPDENRKLRFKLIEAMKKNGTKPLIKTMLPNLISEYTKQNNPELVSKLETDFEKCPTESAIAAMRGMAERLDHSHILEKIDIPTLLIFGEDDKITNLEIAQKMHSGIKNSQLKIIKNAGHYANLENPTEFNSALVNFIKRVDSYS